MFLSYFRLGKDLLIMDSGARGLSLAPAVLTALRVLAVRGCVSLENKQWRCVLVLSGAVVASVFVTF